MDPLSEELVDETWEGFAGYTDEQAYEEAQVVGKNQPEILAFIMEMTEDLDQEIRELAIYMFFVIHRMFNNGYGKKIQKVTSEEIITCYEDNEKLLESLGGVHEKFFERIARVQMSSQPYVIRYIVETLFEADQEEDPILLGEEDMGYLFLLMKTVVDVLNKKTDA
ncbi:MAG TPA: hypothetical protein DDX85_07465 [Nitrospiraceae bacterium]|nr:hypothetical protein [Nitrospiraceae bacterium]